MSASQRPDRDYLAAAILLESGYALTKPGEGAGRAERGFDTFTGSLVSRPKWPRTTGLPDS